MAKWLVTVGDGCGIKKTIKVSASNKNDAIMKATTEYKRFYECKLVK